LLGWHARTCPGHGVYCARIANAGNTNTHYAIRHFAGTGAVHNEPVATSLRYANTVKHLLKVQFFVAPTYEAARHFALLYFAGGSSLEGAGFAQKGFRLQAVYPIGAARADAGCVSHPSCRRASA
jgi:hypothetical protein